MGSNQWWGTRSNKSCAESKCEMMRSQRVLALPHFCVVLAACVEVGLRRRLPVVPVAWRGRRGKTPKSAYYVAEHTGGSHLPCRADVGSLWVRCGFGLSWRPSLLSPEPLVLDHTHMQCIVTTHMHCAMLYLSTVKYLLNKSAPCDFLLRVHHEDRIYIPRRQLLQGVSQRLG